jgi:hypothetical protein
LERLCVQSKVAVLIIERWLLGRLRHRRFYSLAELNTAIVAVIRQSGTDHDVRKIRVPAA